MSSHENEFDFTSPRQKNLIPDNDRNRYAKLKMLEKALRQSWGKDVCVDWEQAQWTPELPAFGQCAVSALVVQDFFGGTIVKDTDHDHYWSVLDDGSQVDLTREQFSVGIELIAQEPRVRERMLDPERNHIAHTAERYATLRQRVENFLK